MSALHFGDMSKPVKLVFLHANGFNALSYRLVFERLNIHSVIFDMRGHGHSRHMPQDPELKNWHVFRDDCIEFFERYLPDSINAPPILAGHSFGAVSAALAAPFLKGRIKGYVGFDPVSVPLLFRLFSFLPVGRAFLGQRIPIARKAAQRRSVFDSPEQAFTHWHGRGAFKHMSDDTLRDYIEGGLFQTQGDQWELGCAPIWERRIFIAQWHNIFKAARDLPNQSKIIYAGGRQVVSTPGTRSAMQKAQPNIDVHFDPNIDHLFPFYQAELAIDAINEVLGKI